MNERTEKAFVIDRNDIPQTALARRKVPFARGANASLLLLIAFLLACAAPEAQAQSPVGRWRTIDDETNEPKAVVLIYEKGGKLYGKIAEVLQVSDEAVRNDAGQIICTACEGTKKNQPIVGLVIIEGMERDGDEWAGGTILDPQNGKTYKATMELIDANTLEVRGYIGIPLFGRSQTWYRVPQDTSGS